MRYHITLLKDIRSNKIIRHVKHLKRCHGIILLSCGNAYNALKQLGDAAGIKVVGLSTSHQYEGATRLENRYYTKREIRNLYPGWFNATPGALSHELMSEVGSEIYRRLTERGYHREKLYVPVGSGETLISLSHHIGNLIGFTCDNYPPLHLDYSYLSKELEPFTVVKIENIDDASSIPKRDESMMVTW